MSCIDATQLSKMIDIPKFNKMINNTTEVASNFLNSYTEKQNGNKRILEDRNAKILEERYRKTAMDKKRNMTEKHQSVMDILNREHLFLQQQMNSMQNTTDLFDVLSNQNSKMKTSVENEIHTIELSDRKTYYEDARNIYLGWWSNILTHIYWLIIIVYTCGIIFTRRYTEKRQWLIVFMLIIYPRVANLLFYLIATLYHWAINNLKSIYIVADI
tara:strand:- start:572 stop:1216 length:645 start_codon:yes stop_codon:yes gene_type:complete